MFAPDDQITRAEFATMAARFAKLETGTRSFPDVTPDHWAYKYIVSAAEKGWVNGYEDGTFRPDNNITRYEAVTLIDRATGRIPDKAYIDGHISDLISFPDVADEHWAYYFVEEAANTHNYSQHTASEEWYG